MKNINKITKRKYEGYIWYSHKEEPKVLFGEEDFAFNEPDHANPFVIEALLYDRENEISVMVKHAGRHIISEIDLKNLPSEAVLSDEKQYYPHRLNKKVSKVGFKQLWLPERDENCEKMEVLHLKAIVFTGFEQNETDK